jgi:imidazolonepropionase-like amidohydrolase
MIKPRRKWSGKRPGTLVAVLLAVWVIAAFADSPETRVASAPYDADSGSVLIRCGALIDGRSDEVMKDVSVLIEEGRFSRVATQLETPPGVEVLDLAEYTCLPGLIDMHTHMLESFEELVDLTLYYGYTHEDNMKAGRKYSQLSIGAGFTTVRSLGNYYGWVDRDLRDEINRGDTVGPRLQASGFYLTIPGGGGDLLETGGSEDVIPAHLRLGVSRSVDEFRQHAQAAVDGGADVIKVIASGAVLAYGGVPGEAEMSFEEIAVVVEVAHAAGLKVAAHAHGAQSIKDAIRAGANSIEHATYIDDEGIALAIEHDVVLIMDIGAGDWMIEQGRKQGWVDEFLRKTIETTRVQRESFKRAYEAGAPIAFGTDVAIFPHGMNGIQFAYMVEWGMTPMETIQAATSVAARYMGWEERVGAIEPGLFGDLVAVRGDPLADISILENIEVVVKGGLVFKAPAGKTP